ncbi:LOW QUALITY PROTEIN: phosphatidylinositol-glycan biosynthesis class X protein-like [Telopea speciosissima]|uniref:LOW QUALITY PROTEIN: phosphatidylinositol-glycan biosynthesis class X protein-like n=1 Tax=Telopea speciosissima TaxID=54955 RepID=UPI001CC57862|nr:LOW QUALITY PROTEIN: phosphatidylinositol-glycan biosynthesis class X protein-like [Telopea speciosissima]
MFQFREHWSSFSCVSLVFHGESTVYSNLYVSNAPYSIRQILSGFGASDHSSSFPREVGRRNLNVDYKSNQNASSLPYSLRYIMESFFKHDSLLDANSQDFLAHESSLGSCKELPLDLSSKLMMSMLPCHLIGEGSHRHLISSIKINIQPGAISELPSHSCKAIIIERVPSGAFADPFELQHLVEHDVFMDAAIFGDTNLELPSALSNQSVVEIHMNRASITCTISVLVVVEQLHMVFPSQSDLTEKAFSDILNIILLQPLFGSGYLTIQMDLPDLFINCSIEENLQHQNCIWMSVTEGSEFRTSIVWKIPSGNSEHAKFVSAITFISALSTTLLIVVTSIFPLLIAKSKNLKHS